MAAWLSPHHHVHCWMSAPNRIDGPDEAQLWRGVSLESFDRISDVKLGQRQRRQLCGSAPEVVAAVVGVLSGVHPSITMLTAETLVAGGHAGQLRDGLAILAQSLDAAPPTTVRKQRLVAICTALGAPRPDSNKIHHLFPRTPDSFKGATQWKQTCLRPFVEISARSDINAHEAMQLAAKELRELGLLEPFLEHKLLVEETSPADKYILRFSEPFVRVLARRLCPGTPAAVSSHQRGLVGADLVDERAPPEQRLLPVDAACSATPPTALRAAEAVAVVPQPRSSAPRITPPARDDGTSSSAATEVLTGSSSSHTHPADATACTAWNTPQRAAEECAAAAQAALQELPHSEAGVAQIAVEPAGSVRTPSQPVRSARCASPSPRTLLPLPNAAHEAARAPRAPARAGPAAPCRWQR